ncbi:hypothetical protein AL520_30035 [Achromobacter xylosoxidans]|nr:hypothetical protein AL520_30035 [Achromobacter xylosoxidans]
MLLAVSMSRSSLLPPHRGNAPDPCTSFRSAFLASAWRRMAYAVAAAAALWALTGWALDWWPR